MISGTLRGCTYMHISAYLRYVLNTEQSDPNTHTESANRNKLHTYCMYINKCMSTLPHRDIICRSQILICNKQVSTFFAVLSTENLIYCVRLRDLIYAAIFSNFVDHRRITYRFHIIPFLTKWSVSRLHQRN